MCVIAVKPKGIDMPTEEVLQQMWNSNKDGAGFMYNNNGRVQIRKGFMTFEDFKRNLQETYDELTRNAINLKDDVAFVYHFRIATHGTIIPENTHPFPVTDNLNALKALDVSTTLGMAHNGIIRTLDDDKANNLTDTATFVKDVVVPFQRHFTNAFLKLTNITKFIENTINASRLAFLDGEGNVTKIGSWSEGACNLSYSNKNHVPYVPSYPKYNTAGPYEDLGEYGYVGKTVFVNKTLPPCTVREIDLADFEVVIHTPYGGAKSTADAVRAANHYLLGMKFYLTHNDSVLLASYNLIESWNSHTTLKVYLDDEFEILLKGTSKQIHYGDLELIDNGPSYAVEAFKIDTYLSKTQFDTNIDTKPSIVLKKVPHKGYSLTDANTGVYIPELKKNRVYMDKESNLYIKAIGNILYGVPGGLLLKDGKPESDSLTTYDDLRHVGRDGKEYSIKGKLYKGVVVYE